MQPIKLFTEDSWPAHCAVLEGAKGHFGVPG